MQLVTWKSCIVRKREIWACLGLRNLKLWLAVSTPYIMIIVIIIIVFILSLSKCTAGVSGTVKLSPLHALWQKAEKKKLKYTPNREEVRGVSLRDWDFHASSVCYN